MNSDELFQLDVELQPLLREATEQNITELATLLSLEKEQVRHHLAFIMQQSRLPLWQVADVVLTFHRCIAHQTEQDASQAE